MQYIPFDSSHSTLVDFYWLEECLACKIDIQLADLSILSSKKFC